MAVPSPLLANYGLLDPPWDPKRVHIGPGHTGGATIKASLDDLVVISLQEGRFEMIENDQIISNSSKVLEEFDKPMICLMFLSFLHSPIALPLPP